MVKPTANDTASSAMTSRSPTADPVIAPTNITAFKGINALMNALMHAYKITFGMHACTIAVIITEQ